MNGEINIGKLGESIACRFLEEKGFDIVERNYREKFGEIDIIAEKTMKNNPSTSFRTGEFLTKIWSNPLKITHFIEVKAIQTDLSESVTSYSAKAITDKHETEDRFRPEDNIHPLKLKKLERTIEAYLNKNVTREKFLDSEDLGLNDTEWQFDVVSVWIDLNLKKTRVKHSENFGIN